MRPRYDQRSLTLAMIGVLTSMFIMSRETITIISPSHSFVTRPNAKVSDVVQVVNPRGIRAEMTLYGSGSRRMRALVSYHVQDGLGDVGDREKICNDVKCAPRSKAATIGVSSAVDADIYFASITVSRDHHAKYDYTARGAFRPFILRAMCATRLARYEEITYVDPDYVVWRLGGVGHRAGGAGKIITSHINFDCRSRRKMMEVWMDNTRNMTLRDDRSQPFDNRTAERGAKLAHLRGRPVNKHSAGSDAAGAAKAASNVRLNYCLLGLAATVKSGANLAVMARSTAPATSGAIRCVAVAHAVAAVRKIGYDVRGKHDLILPEIRGLHLYKSVLNGREYFVRSGRVCNRNANGKWKCLDNKVRDVEWDKLMTWVRNERFVRLANYLTMGDLLIEVMCIVVTGLYATESLLGTSWAVIKTDCKGRVVGFNTSELVVKKSRTHSGYTVGRTNGDRSMIGVSGVPWKDLHGDSETAVEGTPMCAS